MSSLLEALAVRILAVLREALAARDARLSAELARLTALLQVRDAPAGSMTVSTAATVGASVLDTLNAMPGAVTVFEPHARVGAPIADDALASRLLQCPNEASLVAALTPTLRELRGLHARGADAADAFSLALVNSEERKWLDDLCALKACCDASPGDVSFEFSQLVAAAAADAPVVRVVKGSLRAFFDEASGQPAGGGYLMAEVLAPYLVKTAAQREAAFAALAALHAAGLAHGDARKPNLLARGGSLVWIDLRAASVPAGEAAQRADAATLAASMSSLPLEAACALYAGPLAHIPGRGPRAYAELAAAVATGVWEG